MIVVDIAGVLNYRLHRADAYIFPDLNEGRVLTPEALYAFDLAFQKNDEVNFFVDTDCTVMQCDVYKIRITAP